MKHPRTFAAIASVLALIVGYSLFFREKGPSSVQDPAQLADVGTTQEETSSVQKNKSPRLNDESGTVVHFNTPPSRTGNTIPMDQARLQTLLDTLGTDATGKSTKKLLIALSLIPRETSRETSDDTQKLLAELKRDADATMDKLLEGMERLDSGRYANEKSAILTFMADLETKQLEFMHFTQKEFTRPVPFSETGETETQIEYADPESQNSNDLLSYILRAHYLHISGPISPEEAFQSTLAGIQSQSDPRLKQLLGAQFLQKFPHMKEALKAAAPLQWEDSDED